MFGKLGLGLGLGGGGGAKLDPATVAYIQRVEADGGNVINPTSLNRDILFLKEQGLWDTVIAAGVGLFWTKNSGVKIDTTTTDTVSKIYNVIPFSSDPETQDTHNFSNNVKSEQPLWADGVMKCIHDGTIPRRLLGGAGTLSIANNKSHIVSFATIKHISAPTSTGYVLCALNSGGGGTRYGFGRNTTKLSVVVSNNDATPNTYSSADDMNIQKRITISSVFAAGANGYVKLWQNKTEYVNQELNISLAASNSASVLIGDLGVGGVYRPLLAEVHALIVLPFSVSDSDRGAVEDYLIANYGEVI